MPIQSNNNIYAGFFVRFAAFITDYLIAHLAVSIVKIPFAVANLMGATIFTSKLLFQYTFMDILTYVGVATYFVLLTYYTHTTLGKRLLRLELTTNADEWNFINILFRETVGRYLSSFLYIGYLIIPITKEKQGFHDMLCDTYVVYKDSLTKKDVVETTSTIVEELEDASTEDTTSDMAEAGTVDSDTNSADVEPAVIEQANVVTNSDGVGTEFNNETNSESSDEINAEASSNMTASDAENCTSTESNTQNTSNRWSDYMK